MNMNTGGRLTGKQEKQIKIIGDHMMAHRTKAGEKPFTAAIAVDNREKADLYEKRLKELYPEIIIMQKFPGGPGIFYLKVQAPPELN